MEPFRIEGYGVRHTIRFEETENLYLHEETEPFSVSRIARSIKLSRVIRHPVITEESRVVLDGSHRADACRLLNIQRVPVSEVNYSNPKIRVERWIRVVKGLTLSAFVESHDKHKFSESNFYSVEHELQERNIACYLTDGKRYWSAVPKGFFTLRDLMRTVKNIEAAIRRKAWKISYVAEEDAHISLRRSKGSFLVFPPRLSKDEVLSSAHSRRLFPPKSTRHIVPGRPMRMNVPLDLCEEPGLSLHEATLRLGRKLKRRNFIMMSPGSRLGSRRYHEKVLVFQ